MNRRIYVGVIIANDETGEVESQSIDNFEAVWRHEIERDFNEVLMKVLNRVGMSEEWPRQFPRLIVVQLKEKVMEYAGSNAAGNFHAEAAAAAIKQQDYMRGMQATTATAPPQPSLMTSIIAEISQCVHDCMRADDEIGAAVNRLLQPRPVNELNKPEGVSQQATTVEAKLNILLSAVVHLRASIREHANELDRAI